MAYSRINQETVDTILKESMETERRRAKDTKQTIFVLGMKDENQLAEWFYSPKEFWLKTGLLHKSWLIFWYGWQIALIIGLIIGLIALMHYGQSIQP